MLSPTSPLKTRLPFQGSFGGSSGNLLGSKGAPQLSIRATPAFIDDIEAAEWLAEVGLDCYAETFVKNFGKDGGTLLKRSRLAQVKIHHLSQMNIENFDHQKLLIKHIEHTLQFAYHSPVRKQEVMKMVSLIPPEMAASLRLHKNREELMAMSTTGNLRDMLDVEIMTGNHKRADHKQKVKPARRRSFDHAVWNHVHKLRNHSQEVAAVDKLRSGAAVADDSNTTSAAFSRRRWSFGEDLDVDSKSQRAKVYGNRAQEFDMMQKELSLLQHDHLHKYKQLINCERASIFFVHERTRELILCTEDQWYRLPQGCGIAGHSAETGEALNIVNVYEDFRFNQNVDLKTGFRTRSILSQPLRQHRGGGSIIGVIQMVNKIGAEGFDAQDEDTLAVCVQRIADDLNARFRELLNAAEKFSASSVFIGEKGGHLNSPNKNSLTKSTAASRNNQTSKFHAESAGQWSLAQNTSHL